MSGENVGKVALERRGHVLLAGQDVISPGVPGAFMGGLLAAASVEPSLWPSLRD